MLRLLRMLSWEEQEQTVKPLKVNMLVDQETLLHNLLLTTPIEYKHNEVIILFK